LSGGANIAASDAVAGFPGAAGVVQGRVRAVLNPEDSDKLEQFLGG